MKLFSTQKYVSFVTSFFDGLPRSRLSPLDDSFADEAHKFLDAASLEKPDGLEVVRRFQPNSTVEPFVEHVQGVQFHHCNIKTGVPRQKAISSPEKPTFHPGNFLRQHLPQNGMGIGTKIASKTKNSS